MKGTIFSVDILKTEVKLTPEEKASFIQTIEETGKPKDERTYNTDYEDTLFDMCPEFQKVVDAAIKLVEDEVNIPNMKLDDWEYWAHIHEKNMSTDTHAHHPDAVSCVYYLNVPEGSGDIVFIPEPHFIPTSMIESVEGELLVFPGWLKHKVTRHQGDEKRISVSFNLYPNEIMNWRLAGRTSLANNEAESQEETQDEA
jgi:hypothetical protein